MAHLEFCLWKQVEHHGALEIKRTQVCDDDPVTPMGNIDLNGSVFEQQPGYSIYCH